MGLGGGCPLLRKISTLLLFIFGVGSPTLGWAKTESWYLLTSLDYPVMRHNSGWGAKAAKYQFEASKLSYGGFELGILYPVISKSTAVGLIQSLDVESYKSPGLTRSISYFGLGVGMLHFFGQEVGKGIFLKAKVGGVGAGDQKGTLFIPTLKEIGAEAQAGGGVGFGISEGTRILLGANFDTYWLKDGMGWSMIYFVSVLF